MADNMNPQEIAQEMERLKDLFESGYLSAKEFNDRMKDATIGIRGYTQNLRNSMDKLGTSFKALGDDMYKGTQGVGQYGKAMESGADVVAAYTLKFGPAGVALGAFTKAVTAYVTASLKQSDILYDSFQKISRTGTIGQNAMRDLYNNASDLGYIIESELGDFGQFMSKSSKGLGQFSKSVVSGTKDFVEVTKDLHDPAIRLGLFNLGLNVQDINSASMGYYQQLGRLGRATDRTSQGAQDYIREMEILTRLTGLQREEMEANRAQLENIDSFYAQLMQMDPKNAEMLRGALDQLGNIDPKYATAFAEIMGNIGIPQSKEAMEFLQGTNFEALAIKQKVLEGKYKDSGEIIADIGRAMGKTLPLQQGLAQVSANFAGSLKSQNLLMGKANNEYKETADAVDRQRAGLDGATDAAGRARDSQRRTAKNLQDFVNFGVAPATEALTYLTDSIEYLTDFLPGAKKGGQTTGSKGYGATGTGTMGGSLKSTAAGAAAGAIAGSVVPGVGTAIGGAIGGAAGFFGYNMFGGGTGEKPEDIIEFGGNSGDRSSFDQLDDNVKKALMGGASTYFKQTGRKLRLNSAARSPEKQKELYDAWIASGKRGMPVAPPGSSLHEQGLAVDVEQGKGDRDAIAALNSVGLFQTVPNDPVHFAARGAGMAMGGISVGPSSGYQALLHGTEAVVPLPDGRSIPVQVTDQDNSIMTAQLDRLDELVSIMKNQLSVSTKIMQYSH